MPRSTVIRRVVYVLACLLPVWALVAHFTGGVGWMLGPVRLSSRQPLRPLIAGLAVAGWYVWKYPRAERESDGAWMLGWFERTVPFAVTIVVALGSYYGIRYGSFAAAGSDSYGYLSQARLWLSGSLKVEQPWVEQLGWQHRDWAFTPLGYRPFSPDGTIVPTYPPGLPIVMAACLAVFGENGPFFVVPVFAALLLWLTYVLGRDVTGSKGAGALAALLLLASPVFLNHIMVPMSDVPAAAGWTLVLVLVLKQRTISAGWAAGLSLLVRPNLFLLALVPVAAWRHRPELLKRYASGLAPGVLMNMALNTFLYGGPFQTGYGSLFESFSIASLPANLGNYGTWLVQTQTPLILLAIVPLVVRNAVRDQAGIPMRAWLGTSLALTLLSYVFYAVFDHWFYLRFLLPAYPVLFVLMAAAIRWLGARLPADVRVPAAALVCGTMMLAGVNAGREAGIFRQAVYEQRHVRAAAEVASRTPQNAVVLSVQHSGSVRYYANRVTLRYDWLAAEGLDAALGDLEARGYRPYLVVDDWEEREFRARFSSSSRLGRLDRPVARVPGSPEVRVYELQDRGPAATP
jgi:hypothetical protein